MQQTQQQQLLTIFHFNDIYNIQPYTQQPKGGAAYFQSLLQRQKKKYKHPLTLFSGDAFSPALISYQFQGQNMIKPLNAFGIDLACYGNHDFDYQLDHVSKLVKQTNFPWLLSNIYDQRTGRRLGQALETYIFNENGLKIGVFSLAEQEWIDTLYPYYKTICNYHPFIPFAEKMVHKLRIQQQCNLVIALTHMMKYNDIKLAKQVKGIDLILGGHDHLIVHQKIADSVIVKSGTDFKYFSVIKVHKNVDKNVKETVVKGDSTFLSNKWWNFEVELKEVHHQNQKIQPDQELDQYIEEMYKELKVKNQKIACFTKKQIDLRFNTIRKEQTPYLQFLVSIYRHQSSADVAMMNTGNFRMDTLIKPGPITFGVIQNIITDTVIVKIVPADILVQALEVSVSMYPNLAGRYSVFSGIGFNWDASKKPLERVLRETILIHNQPIDMSRTYSLAIHSFVGDGGDGYQCLKQCQTRKGDGDKTNRQLLHDLLHVNHYLLDSYMAKYPNRFNIIQHEGRQCLELDVPDAKNVHMVLSTGHIYGH